MRKLHTLLALMLTLSLTLSACGILGGQEPEAAGEIDLPEPSREPDNMILGETLSGGFTDVTFYFASQDGTSFSTVTRSIRTESGRSLPEAAVYALMESIDGRTIHSIGDTRVLACEYACGTVTVNLSIDARNVQNPQELLGLQIAIGNTLLGIDGVDGVNVLIGDVSEGYCSLPVGVQTEILTSVTAAYAQLQAERDRQAQADAEPIVRSALLYFPTNTGDWLVPELREITARSGGLITALIDALKGGPGQVACAVASIPEGVELMGEPPAIRTLSSGERILELNFSSTLANYLAFSGLEVWELAGSLGLTMCSFLPELDAVRVMVNSDPITMCDIDGTIIQFRDGLIRRSDFAGRIGSAVTLYLADSANRLEPVQRAVSTRSAFSPRSLLSLLLEYAGETGGGLSFPIPGGVYPEDILGVQAIGGIARVNLSGSFYRSCQGLDAGQERCLVYSMVNTLCALESIRGVRFLVEGSPAETLAGSIYIRSALLPNPGIVAAE